MLVAWRHAPGQHALPLVLRQLVEAVGDLKPITSREEIQVKDILWRRLPVETVKDAAVIAPIVDRKNLRRVEEMTRANSIESDEVSKLRTTDAQTDVPSPGSKRTPLRFDVAKSFGGAQAGARGGIYHQAGLVAVLRVLRSGDQLHTLDSGEWNLRRKRLALLSGD